LGSEEWVSQTLEDLENSPLPEKDKRLLRFVAKVNHESPTITAADISPLHEVSWSDEAIYLAITVCALFNFYNRWIDDRASMRCRMKPTVSSASKQPIMDTFENELTCRDRA
jgi:hypothetical protein